jgi:hypothetical protein
MALKASRELRRRAAHGGNAVLITVLVIVLTGVLYGVADRNRVRVDLTEEGANSLLADTQKKLELLEKDGELVTVTAFTAQEGKADSYFKNRAIKDLLLELDYQSATVETHFVDFDRERLTAEELGVREYGHMVVQRGEERVDIKARELFRSKGKGADKTLEFLGESAFNRAASQLLSKRRKTVYTLVGHGEKSITEAGANGMSGSVDALEQENYELQPLDLYRDRDMDLPTVPADASGLVIAGATRPLTEAEEDAVVAYVANGGALMVLLDPGSPVPYILERLDIVVPEGIVADKQVYFPFPDRPVVSYGRHNIVDDLRDGGIHTMFPHIAPVRMPEPLPDSIRATEVVRTSRDGWIDRGGEVDLGRPRYEPDIDGAGPVTYGWALELQPGGGLVNEGKRVSRVLVIGDSDWATDDLLASGPGNATFLVNSFRWLVWDDARLSVIGTPTAVHRLALTEEDQGRIRWLVTGLLPLLMMLLGLAVWASRRGR